MGYFTNVIDNLSHIENEYFASFSLGYKIENIAIKIPEKVRKKYANYYFFREEITKLKTKDLETYLESIVSEFDNQGQAFTQVNLKDIQLSKNKVYATLNIQESEVRKIDKVIVNGYEKFPKSFLSKFFKIGSKKSFSKNQLKEVSSLTKSLDFVDEIKPPEVLFKQDSTILYLFLKRVRTSSVDGIINFASKEDGSGILINGNLDLKLNNAINTGEKFELFWNRVKEQNSEFRLTTELPYLFDSDFSIDLSFNIYRQDSTFLNTNFKSRLNYQVNSNSKIYISYFTENSDFLLDQSDENFDTYRSNFIGLGYSYNQPSTDPKFDRNNGFQIYPNFGKRKSSEMSVDQIRVDFSAEANISISSRSYLNILNHSSILSSDNYLTNELYRIGGANSVRGFNEQSIFTNRYSYFNLEYRYLTSINSYLHSITDIGYYQNITQNKEETLLGLGLGYTFTLNSNRVNLGYAIGMTRSTGLDLNNSQVIIKWTSIF